MEMTEDEKYVLTMFDRDSNFGPKLGITRMVRYTRLVTFDPDFKPDDRILPILQKYPKEAQRKYTFDNK